MEGERAVGHAAEGGHSAQRAAEGGEADERPGHAAEGGPAGKGGTISPPRKPAPRVRAVGRFSPESPRFPRLRRFRDGGLTRFPPAPL